MVRRAMLEASGKQEQSNGVNIFITQEPSTLRHYYRTIGAAASEIVICAIAALRIDASNAIAAVLNACRESAFQNVNAIWDTSN
jgi:hypothetical protein